MNSSDETERHPRREPNAAQLKNAIDEGRTGDKVAWPDPAAAPLGTDDEAAGTPPTPERVEMAMDSEIRRPHRNDDVSVGDKLAVALWISLAIVPVIALIAAVIILRTELSPVAPVVHQSSVSDRTILR